MSNKATLEIKKFDGKRDLRSEIISFYFDDSSAVSPALSGRIKLDKVTVRLLHGDASYLLVYWHRDSEKVYSEMIIKGRFSSGKNGTQTRAVFTFHQVKVNGYGNDSSSGEVILTLNFGFEKFSYFPDSTAGALK